jgi:hypothetical protein
MKKKKTTMAQGTNLSKMMKKKGTRMKMTMKKRIKIS